MTSSQFVGFCERKIKDGARIKGDTQHALTLLRFLLLLSASEAASHTVPFITSAYSTNLLSGRAGDEARQVQQISELRASLALPKTRSRVKACSAWTAKGLRRC